MISPFLEVRVELTIIVTKDNNQFPLSVHKKKGGEIQVPDNNKNLNNWHLLESYPWSIPKRYLVMPKSDKFDN